MALHPTPGERLLSMLEDEDALEALPAGEVQDGLAALGVEPARSVAFARSLARDGGSPGRRLIGALMAGESEDEEIARIESADIEEVRANVDLGTAAAIAAKARLRTGVDDRIVGLEARRRKRRRLMVWGGPLTGIAASFLVVVIGLQMLGGRFQRLFEDEMAYQPTISREADHAPKNIQAETPEAGDAPAKEKSSADSDMPRSAEEALALNKPLSPPPVDGARKDDAAEPEARLRKQEEFVAVAPMADAEDRDATSGPTPQVAKKKQDKAGQAPPPAALLAPAPAPATADRKVADAPPVMLDNLDDNAGGGNEQTGRDDTRRAEAPQSSAAANLPEIAALPEGGTAGNQFAAEAEVEGKAETETETAPPAETALGAGLARNVVISEIAAVLVLDPSQASMQVQSQILPTGELVDRVDEAQRLAGDRPVIALYTIATGDAHRDFAQVPLQTGLSQQLAAPSPLVGLLGVEATEYDFIALPAE